MRKFLFSNSVIFRYVLTSFNNKNTNPIKEISITKYAEANHFLLKIGFSLFLKLQPDISAKIANEGKT